MSSLSSLDGSDDGDDEEPLVWDFCSEIVALTVSNEARRSPSTRYKPGAASPSQDS